MNIQYSLFRKIVTDQNYINLIVAVRIIVGIWIFLYGTYLFDAEWFASRIKLWKDNFSYPMLMLIASKSTEMICGLLLAAGLLTRFASSALIVVMSVASFYAKKGHILPYQEGELAFFYLLFFIVFLIAGGGKYSLDHLLWHPKAKAANNTTPGLSVNS